jgi:hypothetical protein
MGSVKISDTRLARYEVVEEIYSEPVRTLHSTKSLNQPSPSATFPPVSVGHASRCPGRLTSHCWAKYRRPPFTKYFARDSTTKVREHGCHFCPPTKVGELRGCGWLFTEPTGTLDQHRRQAPMVDKVYPQAIFGLNVPPPTLGRLHICRARIRGTIGEKWRRPGRHGYFSPSDRFPLRDLHLMRGRPGWPSVHGIGRDL